jgi:hypothetical protein
MINIITTLIHNILQIGGGLGIGTSLATSAATGGIGLGLGMLQSAWNSQNQQQQNAALIQQQQQSNEEQSLFNEGVQLDLWNKTNYAAQVEQAQKAGINPALLWAKGGGSSGATVAANTVNNPQPMVQGNTGLDIASAIAAVNQTKKTQAEVPNINADTELKAADTQKKESETQAVNLQNTITEQTLDEAITSVKNYVKTQEQNIDLLKTQNKITAGTADALIIQAKENAINAGLNNLLTNKKIGLTEEETKQISAAIEQRNKEIDIARGQLNVNQQNATTAKGQLTVNQAQQKTNQWNAESGSKQNNIMLYNAKVNEANLNFQKSIHNVSDKTKLWVEGTFKAVDLGAKVAAMAVAQ